MGGTGVRCTGPCATFAASSPARGVGEGQIRHQQTFRGATADQGGGTRQNGVGLPRRKRDGTQEPTLPAAVDARGQKIGGGL